MKLSRKIVEQMPVKTQAQIRERENAQAKLKHAEELVDKFHAKFEETMAKDGQEVDTADLEHLVYTEGKEEQEHRFDFYRTTASDLKGTKFLKHFEWTVTEGSNFSGKKHAHKTQLLMETDQERGTTEYTLSLIDGPYGKDPTKQDTHWLRMHSAEPTEFMIVSGQGQDREFRFSRPTRKERLIEGAGNLASKAIAGVLKPLKKLPLPKITVEGK